MKVIITIVISIIMICSSWCPTLFKDMADDDDSSDDSSSEEDNSGQTL